MAGRAIEPLSALLLVTGCILGGSAAPGRILPVVPELVGLPLLTLVAWREAGPDRPPGRIRAWLAAIVLALPVLQLLPLPPVIWTGLPGRGAVADAFSAAGEALPWLPASLAPGETERLWIGLFPAVALFLAVPHLSGAARRRLIHLAIALGVLDAVLGVLQLAGGPDSPLRFYGTASRTDAVGVFANRNHHAAFVALSLVLAGGLGGDRRGSRAETIWLSTAASLLLLGIASAGSRAGLLLGLGASLAAAWCVLSGRFDLRSRGWLAGWSAVAVIPFLLGLLVFGAAALRVQPGSVADDLRWRIAATTWRAIADVFPVGGGFGSFERVYAGVERPDDLIPAIVNNAHDDWLELVLEGGLPALLLLLSAAAVLGRETVAADSDPDRPPSETVLRAATLAALWLCCLHSLVDYPLRTMSVNVLLALACGLRAGTSRPERGAVRRNPDAGRPIAPFEQSATRSR